MDNFKKRPQQNGVDHSVHGDLLSCMATPSSCSDELLQNQARYVTTDTFDLPNAETFVGLAKTTFTA